MRDITISSVSNPLIKQIIKLRKASVRAREDLILVEGQNEVIRAGDAGLIIDSLVYSPELAVNFSPESVMCREIVNVTPEVFKHIAYREHPDGVLALAKPRYLSFNDINPGSRPLVLVLETVEKPGNLGAVLRSADAAGVDAVIVCDPRTDIYNPNVIRASLGAVFSVPVITCATDEALEWLNKNGIKIFSSTPSARKYYTEADLAGSAAIVVGTEHEGLSKAWLKPEYEKIKIPMHGRLDSLNASVSAAVIVFEALRQRRDVEK